MSGQAIYLPRLSSLIDAEAIPGNFDAVESFLNSGIDYVLGNLRYRDYIVEASPLGDSRFYSITIISDKLSLPGDDLPINLVFNPDDITGESIFDVSMNWRWPIQRYFSGFEQEGFSYAPDAFIDILLDLANIESEQEFISSIIGVFLSGGTASYTDFLDTLKTKISTIKAGEVGSTEAQDACDAIIAEIDAPVTGLIETVNGLLSDPNTSLFDLIRDYENLVDLQPIIATLTEQYQILEDEAEGVVDFFATMIQTLIADITNLDDAKDRLLDLFSTWLGNITWDDIEYLLLPQFSLGLNNISMALTFTRDWLTPMELNNQNVLVPQDAPAKSMLTFTVGSVEYSTQTGFTIDIDPLGDIDFTTSMIGDTGIILGIKGMKIDLSTTTNIPEADLEGRPAEFRGVYAKRAVIGLPAKWFKIDGPETIAIYGRNLLVGTGGISGKIGLELYSADETTPPAPLDENGTQEMKMILGPEGGSGGFSIGFKKFEMEFMQGAFIGVDIALNLYLPKLGDDPLFLSMSVDHDGDFDITAKWDNKNAPLVRNVSKGIIGLPSIFLYKMDYVTVGKNDDVIYLETAGSLHFTHSLIKTVIEEPIFLKKLKIGTDGSFEIESGSIPLKKNQEITIGPAKISITAIHCGTMERAGKSYKYWGFDGGLSVNPGGVDARGDGIKFCYDPDNLSDWFLHIEGIGLKLVIPSSVPKEKAALLIEGYLSLKDPVYQGSVAIQLPKMKIAGGAEMKYDTQAPAFIIDAWLELSQAIPLANTGLGIYGFRGMFGMRYVASRKALNLGEDASWFDWYTEPELGINVDKFVTPEEIEAISPGTQIKNPFTIGAGVSLATQADNGKTFSMKLMLLVSIPTLILLDGRANILGERVGLDDEDPPFWAFISFSPTDKSIELGIGADYKLPKDSGRILDLKAAIEAGFFFQDTSAWYLNFGTKSKPISARLLSLFDAYSYLMLSAKGMDAGAGVSFEFKKKYVGVVSVHAKAFFDVWGYVSFERPQIGGGIAIGGSLDVKLFGFGLNISLAAILTVEASKPFRVAGSAEICVGVNLRIKKIEKCFSVEFVWMKSDAVDTNPVKVLSDPTQSGAEAQNPFPATARHMQSGRTYEDALGFQPGLISSNAVAALNPVPLDTFIDFEFMKPVKPVGLEDQIGGLGNGPRGDVEVIPPRSGRRVVRHSYSLDSVSVQIYDDAGNWVDYNPYRALYPNSAIDNVGYWQKSGREYNKIRFLAPNQFSYMHPVGDYEPEGMGLDAHTLFCSETPRARRCVTWRDIRNSASPLVGAGTHFKDNLFYEILGEDGSVERVSNPFGINRSLVIPEGGELHLWFGEPVTDVTLKLGSCVSFVDVIYETRVFAKASEIGVAGDLNADPLLTNPNNTTPLDFDYISGVSSFVEISRRSLTRAQLSAAVEYNGAEPVGRIRIVPVKAPDNLAAFVAEFKAMIFDAIMAMRAQGNHELAGLFAERLSSLLQQFDDYLGQICRPDPKGDDEARADMINDIQRAREEINAQIAELEANYGESCPVHVADFDSAFAAAAFDNARPSRVSSPRGASSKMSQALGQIRALEIVRTDLARRSQEAQLNLQCAISAQIEHCQDLAAQVEVLKSELSDLTRQIEYITQSGVGDNPNTGEDGYQCGCATFLHEVCWMPLADANYNAALPTPDVNAQDLDTLVSTVTNMLPPIWRPGHKFRIVMDVTDTVTDPNGNQIRHSDPFSLGFRTSGPLGYFEAGSLAPSRVEPDDLPPQDSALNNAFEPDYPLTLDTDVKAAFDAQSLQAPETQLKYYVDDLRSYPDPSGKILYAKPLYYVGAQIDLAFKHAYAEHFFTQWPLYVPYIGHPGLPAKHYALDIQIIDPAAVSDAGLNEDYNKPLNDVSVANLADVNWVEDNQFVPGQDIQVLENMLNADIPSGDKCWPDVDLTPAASKVEAELSNLKPKKTYTAVIKNTDVNGSENPDVNPAIVMRYPFTTSRYPSFEAHIMSLERHYKTETGQAFFIHDVTLTAADIGRAQAVCEDKEADLDTQYPDAFDSLIFGIFGIMDIDPPTGTEITFIRETGLDAPIAVWVRSDEPFNDPRLSDAQLAGSLIWKYNGNPSTRQTVIFSKDRTQAVIMRTDPSNRMQMQNTKASFARYEWREGDLEETQRLDISAEYNAVKAELGL